jgi:succinate dehydrogenase/fumarate reductase flavoprotein subunit
MIDAFLSSGPAMLRFVQEWSPHRFVNCPHYPDYHPDLPGATAGGRALDMRPLATEALTRLAARVCVPPGYLPNTQDEWERWRYPQRYDWALLEQRRQAGIRTNGVALVSALLEGVVRARGTIVTETRLCDVHCRAGGGIIAAHLEEARGSVRISCHSLVLASGGFDWDLERRRAWLPPALAATGAPPSNTGDALTIAERLGAALEDLAEGWWMPMIAVPGEMLGGAPFHRALIRERGAPRQILVNRSGHRFVDEAAPYNDLGKALQRRIGGDSPNDPAYLVFDEGFRERYPLATIRPDRPLPDWVVQGDSLADLAARLSIDAGALQTTVRRWNEHCASGVDLEFGRGGNVYDRYYGDPDVEPNPNLGPLDRPPYYAVRVLAGTIGTKGGPVTDADGTVLTQAGTPIGGVFAVGNAAAFWTGDAYPGPGATLGIGMTMGYRAGLRAAARRPVA